MLDQVARGVTRAIVFDLDGTLVHSAPDLHAAANRMLADAGHEPLDLDTVTNFIGNGLPNLVRRVMEDRGIPEDQEEEMKASMLAHYIAHPVDLTRPYDGVVDALAAFQAAGHRMGICTNKLRAPAVQILEALDLMRFFDVVVGGDSLDVKKPDPAPLMAAFKELDRAPLAFVGDSEVDAETARRAELPFALFTRGYRKEPVESLPHDIAFDDFGNLPESLNREIHQ